MLLPQLALALSPLGAGRSADNPTFRVIWNSPWPSGCPNTTWSGSATRRPRLDAFGIEANEGDDFNGETIFTFYTSFNTHGIFSAIPRYVAPDASCKGCPNAGCCVAVNGGIPQRGNLSLHLSTVAAAVRTALPPSFAGVSVLDWEEWYPWYSTAGHADDPGHADGRGIPPALSPRYIVESRDAARQADPRATRSVVEAEAQRAWNASSLVFLVETLKLCRQLRPHARWGYYNHASCWSNDRQLGSRAGPGCIAGQQARNDALAPLWAATDLLLPSVYSGPLTDTPLLNQTWRVQSQLAEAVRIQHRQRDRQTTERETGRRSSTPTAIVPSVYAFTWPDTRSGVLPTQWQLITSSDQLQLEFGEPKRSGANGLIVWGASTDAGVYLHPESAAIARCRELATYVNDTLGPFLRNLVVAM